MPSHVPALAAQTADTPLARTTIARRDLREFDVLVDIAFCGICHSDIHQARDEWGGSIFPMVPGHEMAGTVSAVGPGVTKHAVGDRVGVGCYVDSCRVCENCLAGEEQYCLKGEVQSYNAYDYDGEPTFGGYSTQVVVDENYVLRIPDAIPLDVAAPLLCAGITLWTPLQVWKAGPGTKVAILGMGGLGHMGVKLAAALGAEVTVLSQTTSKQEDGLKFGATAYHATGDRATFKELAGTFDLIINTVAVNLDMDRYLRLLRLDGTLVNVGIPENPDSYRASSLIGGRRRLAGSLIGGVGQTQAMLDFCAEHGIAADIEVIGIDDVNAAYERVIKSDVRYRFVIDIATLAGEA